MRYSIRRPGWLGEPRGFAAPPRDGCACSWPPGPGGRGAMGGLTALTAGVGVRFGQVEPSLAKADRTSEEVVHEITPEVPRRASSVRRRSERDAVRKLRGAPEQRAERIMRRARRGCDGSARRHLDELADARGQPSPRAPAEASEATRGEDGPGHVARPSGQDPPVP